MRCAIEAATRARLHAGMETSTMRIVADMQVRQLHVHCACLPLAGCASIAPPMRRRSGHRRTVKLSGSLDFANSLW